MARGNVISPSPNNSYTFTKHASANLLGQVSLMRTFVNSPATWNAFIIRSQAYWLIDAIASCFGSELLNAAKNRDYRLQSLQFWRLDVTDRSAVLTANADVGEEPFIRQEIPYTDFPLDYFEIWAGFDGNR